MKIIKSPNFENNNICTCEKCGTIFEVEPTDHIECQFGVLTIEKWFVKCPVCDSYVELNKSKTAKSE